MKSNEIMDDLEKKLGKDFKTFRENYIQLEEYDNYTEPNELKIGLINEMNKTVLSKQQMKGLTERLYTKLKRSSDTQDKIDLLGEMVMLLMRERLYGVK